MALTRRDSIRLGGAGVLAAALSATDATAADRPNFLWIVSEDNNPWIGAYGDPLARTPHLDALAGRGVLYRNVYSAAPVCAPSRFAILTGVYPQACGPAHHMRASAHLPELLKTYPEYLKEAGFYCTNNAKTDYNCDIDPALIWGSSGADAHWRQRASGQPFLSVFNFMATHESSLFRATADPETAKAVRIPAYLPDTADIRADFAGYYALMERMDGLVGEKLSELESDGLSDNTIVFYYSDNGGVLPRSKRYCYDEGLRCAMIVYFPPRWAHLAPAPPGRQIDDPVCFVDLAPTLLSLTGLPRAPQMQGEAIMGPDAGTRRELAFGMRNRMDERYDFVRTATDGRYRYIRNYMPHRQWGMHTAFEWQAKSYQDWERHYLAGTLNPVQSRFFGPKPYEEFYDLEADPDQVDNRIDEARLAPLIDYFRSALTAHMLTVNDNGFIPEGAAVEGYDNSRRTGAYPLEHILEVAQGAARGDAGLGRLLAWLKESDDVVRYWAATGLVILGERGRPAKNVLEGLATSDPSVYVQIVVSEALARLGETSGIERLGVLAGPERPMPVRLQALNALTEIGEPARAVMPVIRQASTDTQPYIRRAGTYMCLVLDGVYDPGNLPPEPFTGA